MAVSAFAILRQGISFAKFNSKETRGLILDLVDSLEAADNESITASVEDYDSVSEATDALQKHIIELLGGEIEIDDSTSTAEDEDDITLEEEIERG